METIPIESDHKEGIFMNPIGINSLNDAEMIAIKDKDPIKQAPKEEANKSNNLKTNLLHKRKKNPLDEQAASLRKIIKQKATIVITKEVSTRGSMIAYIHSN